MSLAPQRPAPLPLGQGRGWHGFCCFACLLHATVRFPDVNCHWHLRLMLCTHAPWNTIPHVSWLGCEPTHCVNGVRERMARRTAGDGELTRRGRSKEMPLR
jgi:hypothetical protein